MELQKLYRRQGKVKKAGEFLLCLKKEFRSLLIFFLSSKPQKKSAGKKSLQTRKDTIILLKWQKQDKRWRMYRNLHI